MSFVNLVEKVKLQPLRSENYDVFGDHINAIRDVLKTDPVDPYLFGIDDKIYVTSHNLARDLVVMITEDEYGLATRGVLYNDDNIKTINIQDWNYNFSDDDIKSIQRVDCMEVKAEAFAEVKVGDKKYYQYIQNYLMSQYIASIRYDTCFNQTDYFLTYLNNKNPDLFIFEDKFKKIFKLDAYAILGDNYCRVIKLPFKDTFVLFSKKPVSRKEINDRLIDLEYNTKVPDEMISMFMGNNQDLNELVTISETYRKLTLKK